MIVVKSEDLFRIPEGASIKKRNLFDLIQFSKVEGSPYWSGPEFRIGNTPQQGINWLGTAPRLQAAIIKTRPGSYGHDGWNDDRSSYRYSFKARNGVVSYKETANSILIAQPQHGYPILLFIEQRGNWVCEGQFAVSEIEERHVVLRRYAASAQLTGNNQEEASFPEGGRRYVTHLMVERSRDVIAYLKKSASFICNVCDIDFEKKYGVRYIEAHHKVPISSFTERYMIRPSDLALLCPNCHRSVHVYMKISEDRYEEIRSSLREKLGLSS